MNFSRTEGEVQVIVQSTVQVSELTKWKSLGLRVEVGTNALISSGINRANLIMGNALIKAAAQSPFM